MSLVYETKLKCKNNILVIIFKLFFTDLRHTCILHNINKVGLPFNGM